MASTLTKTYSWIIRKNGKSTALLETFNPAVVAKLNTDKYNAVPVLEYLQDMNKRIKQP